MKRLQLFTLLAALSLLNSCGDNPTPEQQKKPSQENPVRCDNGKTGENCDQCVDSKFTGENCDQCANSKFTGENCDKCANGKFGDNCDRDCEDPKKTGENCDQCAEKFTGTNCDQCADSKFTGTNCDQCANGFTGEKCDKCADNYTGENCDKCNENYYGIGCTEDFGSMTDSSGNSYKTFIFNGLEWMASNMADPKGNNISIKGLFYNAELDDSKYGLYYDYQTAQTICPAPWRLPTIDDYLDLKSYITTTAKVVADDLSMDTQYLGLVEAMLLIIDSDEWSNQSHLKNKGVNLLGFSAYPTGYLLTKDLTNTFGESFAFWIDSSLDDSNNDDSSLKDKYLVGFINKDGIAQYTVNKDEIYTAVRCVKDLSNSNE